MSNEVPGSGSSQENPQQEFAFPEWKGEELKTLAPGDKDGEVVDGEGGIYHPDSQLKSASAPTELEKEIKWLQEARPELADNREALTILAKINISARKSKTSHKTTPWPPLNK